MDYVILLTETLNLIEKVERIGHKQAWANTTLKKYLALVLLLKKYYLRITLKRKK